MKKASIWDSSIFANLVGAEQMATECVLTESSLYPDLTISMVSRKVFHVYVLSLRSSLLLEGYTQRVNEE